MMFLWMSVLIFVLLLERGALFETISFQLTPVIWLFVFLCQRLAVRKIAANPIDEKAIEFYHRCLAGGDEICP